MSLIKIRPRYYINPSQVVDAWTENQSYGEPDLLFTLSSGKVITLNTDDEITRFCNATGFPNFRQE